MPFSKVTVAVLERSQQDKHTNSHKERSNHCCTWSSPVIENHISPQKHKKKSSESCNYFGPMEHEHIVWLQISASLIICKLLNFNWLLMVILVALSNLSKFSFSNVNRMFIQCSLVFINVLKVLAQKHSWDIFLLNLQKISKLVQLTFTFNVFI